MTAETAPGRGFALKTRLPLESHVLMTFAFSSPTISR